MTNLKSLPKTQADVNWKDEYLLLKEYCQGLEHTRSDLWGVNEELRRKIISLELGHEDLQEQLDALRSPILDPSQLELPLNPPPPDSL